MPGDDNKKKKVSEKNAKKYHTFLTRKEARGEDVREWVCFLGVW